MGSSAKFEYMLTVLTGPNAGAQQRLTHKKVVLGSSDAADIVLDDFDGPDVELAFARDRLRVLTQRDGVTTQAGAACVPGEPLYLKVPSTLRLSSRIQINVCAAAGELPSRLWQRLAATIAVIGLLGAGAYVAQNVGGLELIAGARASADPGPMDQVEAMPKKDNRFALIDPAIVAPAESFSGDGSRSLAPLPEAVPLAIVPKPALTVDDATEMLQQELTNADLAGLEVKPDAGVLRVVGMISPRQNSAWRKIRRAYDGKFAHIAPLLLDIEEQNETPPLAVASVWLGKDPEVITRDGLSLALGETTENGWRVETIEANAVRLVRGRQTIVIDF